MRLAILATLIALGPVQGVATPPDGEKNLIDAYFARYWA